MDMAVDKSCAGCKATGSTEQCIQ